MKTFTVLISYSIKNHGTETHSIKVTAMSEVEAYAKAANYIHGLFQNVEKVLVGKIPQILY